VEIYDSITIGMFLWILYAKVQWKIPAPSRLDSGFRANFLQKMLFWRLLAVHGFWFIWRYPHAKPYLFVSEVETL
jgi:hypothetical protein